MPTSVTSKGQVTIPKSIRERLGIVPGNTVDFQLRPDGEIVLTKVGGTTPRIRLGTLRGRAGPGMTTDEIMALTRGETE